MLIVLVAIGHLLSKGITDRLPAAHALYVWIYLFHMPAFIFLAGFFSGARQISAHSLRGIVARLLVPYLVFTVLYSVAVYAVQGDGLRVDLVNPYWLLWFLPVLAPFFVLGALATPERPGMLQRPLARLAGAGVLLTSFTGVALLHERIGTPGALFWDQGYEAQGLGTVAGIGSRLLMYAVGTALLLAVLAVVPTRRSWLTGIGAASLYIYLLHGFLVRGASSCVLDHVHRAVGIAVLVVVASGVCMLLGSPPVRTVLRPPLVEPRPALAAPTRRRDSGPRITGRSRARPRRRPASTGRPARSPTRSRRAPARSCGPSRPRRSRAWPGRCRTPRPCTRRGVAAHGERGVEDARTTTRYVEGGGPSVEGDRDRAGAGVACCVLLGAGLARRFTLDVEELHVHARGLDPAASNVSRACSTIANGPHRNHSSTLSAGISVSISRVSFAASMRPLNSSTSCCSRERTLMTRNRVG